MVRTRDFLVLLLMVSFLAIGGGATALYNKVSSIPASGQLATLAESDVAANTATEPDFTAVVDAQLDTRTDRLAAMRSAVARAGGLSVVEEINDRAPEPALIPNAETPVEDDPVDATVNETTSELVDRCSGYQPLSIVWNPSTITQVEREGMRLYVESGAIDPMTGVAAEVVRVRIPLRQWPLSTTSCIPTDVIGVALDGSLIRNDEQAAYAIFGQETLIGYALDGFPIYGSSLVETDRCGGAMIAGTYQYVVTKDRAGMINCFAGIPTLPQ